jgi:hypothetical protein
VSGTESRNVAHSVARPADHNRACFIQAPLTLPKYRSRFDVAMLPRTDRIKNVDEVRAAFQRLDGVIG